MNTNDKTEMKKRGTQGTFPGGERICEEGLSFTPNLLLYLSSCFFLIACEPGGQTPDKRDKNFSPEKKQTLKAAEERKRLGVREIYVYEYHCTEDNPKAIKEPRRVLEIDRTGRLVKEHDKKASDAKRWEYTYDEETGDKKEMVYYRRGRVFRKEYYNKKGYLTEKRLALRDSAENIVWRDYPVEMQYNPRGDIETARTYNYKGELTREEHYQYHEDATVKQYLVRDHDPVTKTVRSFMIVNYDEKGHQTKRIYSAPGTAPSEIISQNTYNPQGQLETQVVKEDDELIARIQYTYRADGTLEHEELISFQEGEPFQTTRMRYDEQERIVESKSTRENSLNAHVKNTYAANGLLSKVERFDRVSAPHHLCQQYQYAYY